MDRSYDLFVKLVERKVPFLHEVYLREQGEKKQRRRGEDAMVKITHVLPASSDSLSA
jgi:hypothetical protein